MATSRGGKAGLYWMLTWVNEMSRRPSANFAPEPSGHYGASMSAATLPLEALDAAALFQLRGADTAGQVLQGQSLQGRRIVVAMSGGVDSSVVAALAVATGAEVIGITLQLYDFGAATGRKGACCAGDDIRDARAVADRLGIAHYVFDHESRFREDVVERFADEYLAGRTPIQPGIKAISCSPRPKPSSTSCASPWAACLRARSAGSPKRRD